MASPSPLVYRASLATPRPIRAPVVLERLSIVGEHLQNGGLARVAAATVWLPASTERHRVDRRTCSRRRIWRTWRHAGLERDVLLACLTTEPVTVERSPAVHVHVSRLLSASDMAVMAARALGAELSRRRGLPGTIIHHFGTVSEEPAWSTATRLQHELTLERANAFSVSQAGVVCPLSVLGIAASLLTTERNTQFALLVGADKFISPYQRMWAGVGPFSDAAGAVLLDREPGGLRLLACASASISTEDARPPDGDAVATAIRTLVDHAFEYVGLAADTAATLVVEPAHPGVRASLSEMFAPDTVGHGDQAPVWLLNASLAHPLQTALSRDEASTALPLVLVGGPGPQGTLSCAVLVRDDDASGSAVSAEPSVDVRLTAATFRLPTAGETLEVFARRARRSAKWAERMRRRGAPETVYAPESGDSVALASQAVSMLAHDHPGLARTIDCVLYHHTFYFPTLEPRNLIAQACAPAGIKASRIAGVSGQHCASFLAALRVGVALVASGAARVVLLLGADCIAGSLRRVVPDVTIQSDGASATILHRGDDGCRVRSVASVVDGRFFRAARRSKEESSAFDRMLYLNCVRAVRSALADAGFDIYQIDLVITDNMNGLTWKRVVDVLGCPSLRAFRPDPQHAAHICGSDLVMNLKLARDAGVLRRGDRVLLATVGMGGAWSAAVLEA